MITNMSELTENLKSDILDRINDNENVQYRKVWVQYTLNNKKKGLYDFIITPFPEGYGLYDQIFIRKVQVNFVKDKEKGGYQLQNYNNIVETIEQKIKENE